MRAAKKNDPRYDVIQASAATACLSEMHSTVTVPAEEQPAPALTDTVDDGDRPSITEVNGTIARFEMAYSPDKDDERLTFGPPLWSKIPSYVFGVLCVALVCVVVSAYFGSSNSRLYVWIIEGDKGRPIPSAALAFIVFVSGLATVVRAHMRGVVVTKDGIEARYLLPMGVPRVKRWQWAQVHRMVMDDRGIMLELWDSTYERLPDVAERSRLSSVLAHAASKHGIVMTQLD